MLVSDGTAYFAASLLPWKPTYLCAVDAATGELLWSAPAEDWCGDLEGCDPGISHAIKVVPGAEAERVTNLTGPARPNLG